MGHYREMDKLRKYIKKEHQDKYKAEYIEVGDFTYGIPQIRFWGEKTRLKIGKFCSIADGVTIMLGGNHRTDWNSTYPFNCLMPSFSYIKGHPASKGDIVIGNDVWIASDVKIMSGTTIGDGSVIAANALITKDVPPYCIVGDRDRIIKNRFEKDIVEKLLQMKWWDWSDEDIYNVIPFLQSDAIDKLWDYYIEYVKNERKKRRISFWK